MANIEAIMIVVFDQSSSFVSFRFVSFPSFFRLSDASLYQYNLLSAHLDDLSNYQTVSNSGSISCCPMVVIPIAAIIAGTSRPVITSIPTAIVDNNMTPMMKVQFPTTTAFAPFVYFST